MSRNIYIVSRYYKDTVFDKNDKLVYRWIALEKISFNNLRLASRYFRTCNTGNRHKAVLRVKKGGAKCVKR